ncbi:hypothetical protein CLAIMM_05883 isoform 1, partial [Cladophialophora immunda]
LECSLNSKDSICDWRGDTQVPTTRVSLSAYIDDDSVSQYVVETEHCKPGYRPRNNILSHILRRQSQHLICDHPRASAAIAASGLASASQLYKCSFSDIYLFPETGDEISTSRPPMAGSLQHWKESRPFFRSACQWILVVHSEAAASGIEAPATTAFGCNGALASVVPFTFGV